MMQKFDNNTAVGIQGTTWTRKEGDGGVVKGMGTGKWWRADWNRLPGTRGENASAGVSIAINTQQIPRWSIRKVWDVYPAILTGRVGAVRCKSKNFDVCFIMQIGFGVPGPSLEPLFTTAN